jgi:transposase
VFIDYLTRLVGEYSGRKIFLICDNHSTHHAKDTKAWAVQHAPEIELFFLPAYSPHLNPDEYLNQDVKRHIRALHERPTSKPGLKDTLTAFLHGRAQRPEIVRSYFRVSHVQYAA